MNTTTADGTATIEAVANMPAIRITPRLRRHGCPADPGTHRPRAVRAVGRPRRHQHAIDHWDARTGGSWRTYGPGLDGEEYAFHGSFHEVRDDRLVQTFTYEGFPDSVALETMTFEDLGDGRTRLHTSRSSTATRAATGCSPAAWTSASTTATPSSTS